MTHPHKDCRILVFTKAPEPGEVKTRLIPLLTAQGSATLHQELTRRTLSNATQSELGTIELWCTPSCEHAFFTHCVDQFNVELHLQTGGDLGERMHNAAMSALTRASMVLLLGVDCPTLTANDLQAAHRELVLGQDITLVPAEDGGYVLLGIRNMHATLFTDIAWGTDTVMLQTRQRLQAAGMRWSELPPRWDIDRPEDYLRYLRWTTQRH